VICNLQEVRGIFNGCGIESKSLVLYSLVNLARHGDPDAGEEEQAGCILKEQ